MHYFEVYDNAPYLDDHLNAMHTQTLIGRYKKFGDALKLAEDRAIELGLDYKTATTNVKNDNITLVCTVGIFFDVNDNPVTYHDNWDYGRFMSIVRIDLEIDVDLRK